MMLLHYISQSAALISATKTDVFITTNNVVSLLATLTQLTTADRTSKDF